MSVRTHSHQKSGNKSVSFHASSKKGSAMKKLARSSTKRYKHKIRKSDQEEIKEIKNDKMKFFYNPYRKDTNDTKKHMVFDPEKKQKKSQWKKLGTMILKNNNSKLKNTISELNKFKEKKSKLTLKSKDFSGIHTRSISKPIWAKKFSHKKSYMKRLHRDSLARKIFNINSKLIGRNNFAPRKTMNMGRRWSKISTVNPIMIEGLFSRDEESYKKSDKSLKEQNSEYEAKRLKTGSSFSNVSGEFKINIGEASVHNEAITDHINTKEEEKNLDNIEDSGTTSLTSSNTDSLTESKVSVNEEFKTNYVEKEWRESEDNANQEAQVEMIDTKEDDEQSVDLRKNVEKGQIGLQAHLNILKKMLKEGKKTFRKPMKQLGSTHSLSRSFNRSYSNMKYKVKSVYADYFKGRKFSTRNNKGNNSANRVKRIKKKGTKKKLNKRSETVVNIMKQESGKFTKQDSVHSFDYFKRQFTVDNSRIFNPILKSKDIGNSIEGFSKSGISLRFEAGTLSSKEREGSSGNIHKSINVECLDINKRNVPKRERTSSFMNKLPLMVSSTLNFENDIEKSNSKRDNLLGVSEKRRETVAANYNIKEEQGRPSLMIPKGTSLLLVKPRLSFSSRKRGSFRVGSFNAGNNDLQITGIAQAGRRSCIRKHSQKRRRKPVLSVSIRITPHCRVLKMKSKIWTRLMKKMKKRVQKRKKRSTLKTYESKKSIIEPTAAKSHINVTKHSKESRAVVKTPKEPIHGSTGLKLTKVLKAPKSPTKIHINPLDEGGIQIFKKGADSEKTKGSQIYNFKQAKPTLKQQSSKAGDIIRDKMMSSNSKDIQKPSNKTLVLSPWKSKRIDKLVAVKRALKKILCQKKTASLANHQDIQPYQDILCSKERTQEIKKPLNFKKETLFQKVDKYIKSDEIAYHRRKKVP
ncbi:unnamed protein product [Moneuplotes crassus]|uniref:Uncharacterized protein n=1 Tax=Euplotes crassus TaxID=5936 RepID=A0AAD1U3K2_EUPCR|nr:unnamed protein product [Moneuplotes crassus]